MGERWNAEAGSSRVTDENGLTVAEVRVREDLPLVAAAPQLQAALKALVDAYGGNPPDWLFREYTAAVDALAAAERLEP